MPKKKITIKEREMKIFYPEWREDQPFPELLSYKNLVVKPEELADINTGEGQKLTTVEPGADKTSNHPQPVSWLTDAGAMAYEDMVEKAKLGTTIIQGGYIKTDLLTADNIITGTLTALRMRTAGAGNNRLEILAPGYGSYITWWNAANNLQSWIADDFDGHLLFHAPTYFGFDQNIVMGSSKTVDGVDISAFAILYNVHIANADAHHSSTSSGIAITPSSIVTSGGIQGGSLYITGYGYFDTFLQVGTQLKAGDVIPLTNDTGQVGYGDKHWDYIRGNYLLYHIDCQPFQDHDDIQLIKNIKIKNGKYDRKSFPKEVFEDGMYNTANMHGFLIGTIKQLVERVEELEKKNP